MWILPKQLILAFAQATEELTSDFVELSQICARSLMRKSKPSQSSAFLREWKAGNLMRLRSGAISSHFLGRIFRDWWISSLVATHASPSAQLENEPVKTIPDIFGPGLQMEFLSCDQEFVSLKMSKGISRWDSPVSSVIWKKWVTQCRGEYFQRQKQISPTDGKDCFYWPTPSARDWKDTPGMSKERAGKILGRVDQLARAVYFEISQRKGVIDNTNGNLLESSYRLNPRFVETLMGIPVGWTMPSCMQPIANPASVVTTSSAGNAEDTMQTVHALGQIATTTENLTEELRLLGNGVAPATAALAFKTLWKKQTKNSNSQI